MCYNEAPTLQAVVEKCLQAMKTAALDFEILIVNDGSRDGSDKIADRLASENPAVRVIHHRTNQGIGCVLYSAYQGATKKWISIVPSDLEFSPEELLAAVPYLLKDVPVVFYLTAAPRLHRRAVSFMQKLLNGILFRVWIRRTNWVKALPVAVVQKLPLVSRSPVLETEVLIRLKRAGVKWQELPSKNIVVRVRTGGMGKSGLIKAIFASFWESIKLWRIL
jgi:glycosyltransferase involved in cell wall biosynthesis